MVKVSIVGSNSAPSAGTYIHLYLPVTCSDNKTDNMVGNIPLYFILCKNENNFLPKTIIASSNTIGFDQLSHQ